MHQSLKVWQTQAIKFRKERQDGRGCSVLPHPYCQRHDINMRQRERVERRRQREWGKCTIWIQEQKKRRKRAEKLTLDISHLNAVRVLPSSSSSPSPPLSTWTNAVCTVCKYVWVYTVYINKYLCAFVLVHDNSLFLNVVAQLFVFNPLYLACYRSPHSGNHMTEANVLSASLSACDGHPASDWSPAPSLSSALSLIQLVISAPR